MKKLFVFMGIGVMISLQAEEVSITNATPHAIKAHVEAFGFGCKIAPVVIPAGALQKIGKKGCCPTFVTCSRIDGSASPIEVKIQSISLLKPWACKKKSVMIMENQNGSLKGKVQ